MSTQVEVLSLQLDAQQMASQAQQAQQALMDYATGARASVAETNNLGNTFRQIAPQIRQVRSELAAMAQARSAIQSFRAFGDGVRDVQDFARAAGAASLSVVDLARSLGAGGLLLTAMSGVGLAIGAASVAVELFGNNAAKTSDHVNLLAGSVKNLADAQASIRLGYGGDNADTIAGIRRQIEAERLSRGVKFGAATEADALAPGQDAGALFHQGRVGIQRQIDNGSESFILLDDLRKVLPDIAKYLRDLDEKSGTALGPPYATDALSQRSFPIATIGGRTGQIVSDKQYLDALANMEATQRRQRGAYGPFLPDNFGGGGAENPVFFNAQDETLNPNFIGPQRPEFSTPAARESREAEYRAQQKALQDAERETQRLQDQQQRELRRQAAETQREYEQLGQGMASAIVGAFDQMASGAENWRTAAVGAIRQIANEIAQLTIVKPLGGALAGLFGGGVGLGGGALSGGAAAGASAGAMAGARAGFGGVNFNTEGA